MGVAREAAVFGIALVLTLAACSGSIEDSFDPASDEPGASCSLVGCQDGVFLQIRSQDADLVQGVYTFELVTEDVSLRCVAKLPADFDSNDGQLCQPSTFISFVRRTEPSSDRWFMFALLRGTPGSLSVHVERDGQTLLEEDRDIEYEKHYPNGPQCGGACEQSRLELQLR